MRVTPNKKKDRVNALPFELIYCIWVISAANSKLTQVQQHFPLLFSPNSGQDDVCASNPCLHGGSCLSHPSDRFKPKCSCNIGFIGSRCEWMSSCKVWRDIGFNITGKYVIKTDENSPPITVDCDMETDGGGWTVIQVIIFYAQAWSAIISWKTPN